MKSQANQNYTSNDLVMTPPELAQRICWHFRPTGLMLEPCRGDGAFYDAMFDFCSKGRQPDWCEEMAGRDFFAKDFTGTHYDWIVTNPPWSKIGDWTLVSFRVRGDWTDWVPSNEPMARVMRERFPKAEVRTQSRVGFLEKCMSISDNVVLLMTTNHLFTKCRRGMIEAAGFGIKEIAYVPWPEDWNSSGFTLSANHLQRGWKGSIIETNLGGY